MRRLATTFVVLIAIAAWAGAQSNPSAPLAGEQLKLFQSNRELLENLVEHGVELANADTPVAKVKACHASAKDLGRALRDAADRDDPDRVAELGDHLSAVLRHGLVPTIDDARRVVPVGTAAEAELVELTLAATEDAKKFELSIPALGKVGTSAKVKDTRAKLQLAGAALVERNRSR
jgi:hypothetical protein